MFISQPVLRQTLAIIPVALGNFMSGSCIGWLPPTLQKYKNSNDDISFTDDDCSWIASIQFVGFFLGCSLMVLFVDRYGRCAMITLCAIIGILSWTCIIFAKKFILHLLIRVTFGATVGLIGGMAPIYVGENSSPYIRGVFASIIFLLFFGGQLFGCILATYCSYEMAAYILVAVSFANLTSVILLREPAQYLLAKGRESEAENRFFWLRGENENTKNELSDIKTNMAASKMATESIFAFILDRRFHIVSILTTLSFLTGFPAIVSLVSIALAPTERFSSNQLTVLYELLQLVGAIVSPFIIDRIKRRTLWIISSALAAIFHAVSALLYYSKEKGLNVPNYEWLLFGSITAYGAQFAGLMYPLGMTARAEILPQKFRTIGTCFSILINSVIGILVGHSFLWISSNFGMKANFMYFAASALALFFHCYFYMPETKGMSLTQIENMLENRKKNSDNIS